jgi:hypothetical protein
MLLPQEICCSDRKYTVATGSDKKYAAATGNMLLGQETSWFDMKEVVLTGNMLLRQEICC